MRWPMFWHVFKTEVHDNPNLTNRQKSNVLASWLDFDVETTMTPYLIDVCCYRQAVEQLKDIYFKAERAREKIGQ